MYNENTTEMDVVERSEQKKMLLSPYLPFSLPTPPSLSHIPMFPGQTQPDPIPQLMLSV